ncbi:MAG: hypothetical protein LQ350_008002 [Teloschistes chrysophthalmus]|nr:MAG: hypothetical protein LQ350_008002 [Niorma chrysophthalma]
MLNSPMRQELLRTGHLTTGSIYDDPAIRNKFHNNTVVNSTIPLATIKPFINEKADNTIASPMDIQYRNYYEEPNRYVDNGEVNIRGFIQPTQTLLLDDSYRLIEGLIVDSINGGVGFRNHSGPLRMGLGAQWTEDILFIHPETACTQTNLSLHFSISANYFYNHDNGYMADDGGFANLPTEKPEPGFGDDDWQSAFGEAPDLQRRSFALAWWNNQLTARVLNISSSSVGDRYTSEFSNYATLASPGSILISPMNGWYLDSIFKKSASPEAAEFASYGRRCSGFNDTDPSNSSKPYVRCGYFYGVPYPSRITDGQSYRYDLASNWTQQLYTCASSMKASVQTVTFGSNTTNTSLDLSDLRVLAVRPKQYSESALPTWAIEKADGYRIRDINLMWGLANESQVDEDAFEIRRTAELYLPASTHDITFGHIYDSFAAGMAPGAAWNSVYELAAAIRGIAIDFIPSFPCSYSGETDYGLTLKYRNLSRTPEGTAKIMNLIWTDLMAFVVVGTKTGFESTTQSSSTSHSKSKRSDSALTILGTKAVHKMVRSIGYSDFRYAIPAFIVVGILLFSAATATVFALRKSLSYEILEHYINQTSMGRTATQLMYPGIAPIDASTKEWSRATRDVILNVPRPQSRPKNRTRPKLRGRRGHSSPSASSGASLLRVHQEMEMENRSQSHLSAQSHYSASRASSPHSPYTIHQFA